jgi:hypothetical protein
MQQKQEGDSWHPQQPQLLLAALLHAYTACNRSSGGNHEATMEAAAAAAAAARAYCVQWLHC